MIRGQDSTAFGAEVLRRELTIMRCLDVAFALAGLLFFAPLMLVIALNIRIESTGPIFYSQLRIGQGGQQFRLYKFRKFRHTNVAGGPAVTVKNDVRMTTFGRLLERSKLDELPQLWNILRGDMSLVGPRPETLDFADCFCGRYLAVLDHKPGLFGPNQTFFRNEGSLYPDGCDPEQFYREILFPEKALIDLAYYPTRTLRSDMAWIVRGVLAVGGGLRFLPSACSGSSGSGPGIRRMAGPTPSAVTSRNLLQR